MKRTYYYIIIAVVILAVIAVVWYFSGKPRPEQNQSAQQTSPMTFFITSKNPGRGADLGGLSGADDYCQALAATAGASGHVWRAYLSASATADGPAVNARDRIGQGPWKNFRGELIANSLEELHGNNNINKQTALTEQGQPVNGRGDTPNWHDILTGSAPDGRAIATSTDVTCGNWTKNTQPGSAMAGHHDRQGLRDDAPSKSWNSSHLTRGCSLEALATTGSGGLLYCFAVRE